MEVLVLGSGTCAVTKERNPAGYLVKTGRIKILLDCGAGTVRQLVKAEENYKDIDIVVLSHFHPDHSSDLPFLIQAIENTPGFQRKKALYILGPRGIKQFISKLLLLFDLGLIKDRKYDLKVYPLKKKEEILGINFEGKKGNHSSYSIIIKIDFKKKIIAYSGDTDWDPEIAIFSKKADLLILEASWPNQYQDKKEIRKKHLTPKMAAELAKIAEAKKILLAHFYPVFTKGQINKEARINDFKGEILIAKDFLRIKF